MPNSQLTADANNANFDGDESEECLEMSITTPVQVSAAGLAHVGTGRAVTPFRVFSRADELHSLPPCSARRPQGVPKQVDFQFNPHRDTAEVSGIPTWLGAPRSAHSHCARRVPRGFLEHRTG